MHGRKLRERIKRKCKSSPFYLAKWLTFNRLVACQVITFEMELAVKSPLGLTRE